MAQIAVVQSIGVGVIPGRVRVAIVRGIMTAVAAVAGGAVEEAAVAVVAVTLGAAEAAAMAGVAEVAGTLARRISLMSAVGTRCRIILTCRTRVADTIIPRTIATRTRPGITPTPIL